MISFNFIPADIRVPGAYVEFDSSKALLGLPAVAQRIVLIGQRLPSGTLPALTLRRIGSTDEGVAAFGRGSFGAMAARALRNVNDRTECWAIALDDVGGGSAAMGTITVTGPATANGTLALMIAGTRLAIGVATGATATVIAAAIVAAVAATPDLPVTAANAAGVVTLTCRHKGMAGNDIDLRHSYYQDEALPGGVGIAIAAMAGGATNPDINPVWAVLGDSAFATMILPFADVATLGAVDAELERRAGPMVMTEAMAYFGLRGTLGTLAGLGAGRNGRFVSGMGAKASPSHPVAWGAAYGGIVAYHGAIDPARPFQTLAMAGILPPAIPDRFTASERELLLRDGISTFTVDPSGVVAIERAISMYQVNAQALEDVAWLDINTPLTLFYLRAAVRLRIAGKFPRHKLADDGTNFGAGQAIVTPGIIRAELIALFRDLEEAGLVENLEQFKRDLIVERDGSDRNRINALIPPDLVNQLRVFAAQIEFRL